MDLKRARREAKAAVRAGRHPTLVDALRATALAAGERSWPALVARVEGDAILAAARAGRHAEALERAAERPPAAAAARAAGADELLAAAAENRGEAVYALLLLGVDPNVRDAAGRTPLHRAAAAGAVDALAPLAGWVRVNRAAVDRAGLTALELAEDATVRRVLGDAAVRDAPRVALPTAHARAAAAVEAAFLRLLATSPLAETIPVGDGFAVRTAVDDNTRNGVVCDAAPDADVRRALRWLRGRPAQWHVGEDSALGPVLEAAGCRPEDAAIFMAAALRDPGVPVAAGRWGRATPSVDAASTGREGRRRTPVAVADAGALRTLLVALGAEIGDPAQALARRALTASLGFDGALRHHSLDGAALATTFTAGDTVLLEELLVAPGHRRRGLGTWLARHVLAASGATVALAFPTPASRPFLEDLGFVAAAFPPRRTFYLPD